MRSNPGGTDALGKSWEFMPKRQMTLKGMERMGSMEQKVIRPEKNPYPPPLVSRSFSHMGLEHGKTQHFSHTRSWPEFPQASC